MTVARSEAASEKKYWANQISLSEIRLALRGHPVGLTGQNSTKGRDRSRDRDRIENRIVLQQFVTVKATSLPAWTSPDYQRLWRGTPAATDPLSWRDQSSDFTEADPAAAALLKTTARYSA